MNYQEFIKTKINREKPKGFEVLIGDLNNNLFDYQKEVVKWALEKGNCLIAEECGLGKTFQQLEWAMQIHKKTNGNILIVAPLGVAKQTAHEEAPKFGYHVNLCRTQKDIINGINITNYEMIEHFNENEFIAVILDESSILKNFTGITRTKLKEKFINTPYKLCCSATPAPNEFMELLNQADFLGIMDTSKALANYFINDFKTGKWRLKGHATVEFWKWVCTWCIMIDTPADLGFDDSKYKLPKLDIREHIIDIDLIDYTFENELFRDIGTSATSFHKEKKITADDRAAKCSSLIKDDKQYLIWCDTNLEADLLKKYIPQATEVRGNHTDTFKETAIEKFKNGEIKILISKPSIFGLGMNFQNCYNMIFCGLTYSYEDYYQAIKRIHRFGQKNEVVVNIVLGSTESHILNTVREKELKQIEIKNQMKDSIKHIQIINYKNKEEKRDLNNYAKISLPVWL